MFEIDIAHQLITSAQYRKQNIVKAERKQQKKIAELTTTTTAAGEEEEDDDEERQDEEKEGTQEEGNSSSTGDVGSFNMQHILDMQFDGIVQEGIQYANLTSSLRTAGIYILLLLLPKHRITKMICSVR